MVKIKFGAFYNCTKLEKVIIPNSITEIGNHSFSNCTSLKNITIPNSVKTIEKEAFKGCIYNHRTTKTNQKYPSVNL